MDKVCQECGLWQYSNKPCIQGRGILNKYTHLFLIGEAPGSEEAKRGQVFIGRAGRKLEDMIKPYRKYYNIYITNTVKCYPPVSTTNPEKGFRVPKPSEILLCRKFLLEELNQTSTQVLLMPLGNTALYTLLLEKHEGITKALGRFKQITLENGNIYTVLPNYHPSYILRNNKMRSGFERVMDIAAQYMSHGNTDWIQDSQKNNKW